MSKATPTFLPSEFILTSFPVWDDAHDIFLLEKEQFHIYWINLFRNIMGSKHLLFLNPAYNHVCVLDFF